MFFMNWMIRPERSVSLVGCDTGTLPRCASASIAEHSSAAGLPTKRRL